MTNKFQIMRKVNVLQRIILCSMLTLSISLSYTNCVFGQTNNFFGTSPGAPSTAAGGDLPEDSNPNAVLPGLNSTNPNVNPPVGTDFSGDEKRMQKKYKDNLNSAKRLIDKGTQMMKSSGKNVNAANYKKGRILKETGEKWQAQLKASNPFVPAEQKNK